MRRHYLNSKYIRITQRRASFVTSHVLLNPSPLKIPVCSTTGDHNSSSLSIHMMPTTHDMEKDLGSTLWRLQCVVHISGREETRCDVNEH